MRDWQAFVRQHFGGRRCSSDQAIDELAQHVEETWRAARAGGRSEDEALGAGPCRSWRIRPRLPLKHGGPRRAPGSADSSPASRATSATPLRICAARPGFTAVAVITLALGIGANTAIFSVVRALLLEPLPFPQPDRLVMLWEADAPNPTTRASSARRIISTGSAAREVVRGHRHLGVRSNSICPATAKRSACPGIRVSASAFTMLGVAPLMGRTFTARRRRAGPRRGDHQLRPVAAPLRRPPRHHRHDDARINGQPFQIVGVMPPTFRFPSSVNAASGRRSRSTRKTRAAARIRSRRRRVSRPGVTFAAAKAELDTLGAGAREAVSRRQRRRDGDVTPMSDLGVVAARADADRAGRRGRPRAGDRVRQRRQPAARAVLVPPSGVRGRARRSARRAAARGAGARARGS